MDRLEHYIREFEEITDAEDLQHTFLTIANDFQYASCALINSSEADELKSDQTIGIMSDYMASWINSQSHHLTRAFNTGNCPIMLKAVKPNLDAPNGFAIALGSANYQRSVVVVEFPEQYSQELIEKVSWFWLILSHYALNALSRCSAKMAVNFTPREIECLRWVSKGKTSWEVSKILGVSERTVNFHIQNCMKKTNSVNRQQAVTKGLMGGII